MSVLSSLKLGTQALLTYTAAPCLTLDLGLQPCCSTGWLSAPAHQQGSVPPIPVLVAAVPEKGGVPREEAEV